MRTTELALVPPAVRQITAPEVRSRWAGEVAQAILEAAGDRPSWLHIDVDALDAGELPAVSYPQPDGLRWEDLVELIAPLLAAPALVGVSLADFDADHEQSEALAQRIVEALRQAWP
jgi:arginase